MDDPADSIQKDPSFFDKYKIPLIIGILGLFLLILAIRMMFIGNKSDIEFIDAATQSAQINSEIQVDISGAVVKPGVYKLSSNSRTQDLLNSCGGLADDADKDWVAKNINLAKKLTDGTKIYIPKIGENQAINTTVLSTSNDIININSASKSELDTLPGIGEVTADKIISGRPYQAIEELLSKKIISQSVFEKIKEKITAL